MSDRWISIGEFATATQLSRKALRLYDEQALLLPARIDDATGYRFYRSEQIGRGRLIRTLREMGLSLSDIRAVVMLEGAGAERRLAELAKEQDYRHAREKRAFRTALLQMRQRGHCEVPEVLDRAFPLSGAFGREFSADRETLVERFQSELETTIAALVAAGLDATGAAFCRLIDPLSDDEGRLEVVIAAPSPVSQVPHGIAFLQFPTLRCAAIAVEGRRAHASDLAALLDTLFDWFDRHACAAKDVPLMSIADGSAGPRTELLWAYAAPAVIGG
jgi:DNA-binding transcriptional MerR regulator